MSQRMWKLSSRLEEGRKEILYLTTHSTHFYIWLYGVGHMVNDHPDCKRGNPLHHPTNRIAHTTAFVTPVVENWLKREIAQWVHHERSIRRPIAP